MSFRFATAFSYLTLSAVVFADDPPATLIDASGKEVEYYNWITTSCKANWDEECDDTVQVNVPDGYEYCSHKVKVSAWNNASFQVTSSKLGVSFKTYAAGSGSFFDKWGGNFSYIIIVGSVRAGTASRRCASHRPWVKHCHGRGLGACFYDSRCATLDSIAILRDNGCRQNEGLTLAPVLNTPRPLGTFTPR